MAGADPKKPLADLVNDLHRRCVARNGRPTNGKEGVIGSSPMLGFCRLRGIRLWADPAVGAVELNGRQLIARLANLDVRRHSLGALELFDDVGVGEVRATTGMVGSDVGPSGPLDLPGHARSPLSMRVLGDVGAYGDPILGESRP